MEVKTKSEARSVAPRLSGREIRCQSMVLKTFNGRKQLRKCNGLIGVIELTVQEQGTFVGHFKCPKAQCGAMVHYRLDK